MTHHYPFSWPVIGHKTIQTYLQKSIISGKISHAYIFSGPENIGKSTVLRFFFQSIGCFHQNQNLKVYPCGECGFCKQFEKGIYADDYVLKREESSNIGIEQIRTLHQALSKTAFLSGYKFAAIHEAQTMTLSAANALLKMLEEPPAKTVICLLTQSIDALPQTIRSRANIVSFQSVPYNTLVDFFLEAKKSPKEAETLAKFADGKPGSAVLLLEKPEYFQNQRKYIADHIVYFTSKGISENLSRLEKRIKGMTLSHIRTEALDFFQISVEILRDAMYIKYHLPDHVRYIEHMAELDVVSKRMDTGSALLSIQYALSLMDAVKAKSNPRLTLENFLIYIHEKHHA